MPTPTREEALHLFHQYNPQSYGITPEDEELKEGGYWQEARDSLMRGEDTEYLSHLEQQAHEIGLRLVTEADHNKLLDLERKLEAVKTKTEKLKILESNLAILKSELDHQGNVKVVTVEKIVKEIKYINKENRKKQFKAYVYKKLERREPSELVKSLALLDAEAVMLDLEELENALKLPTLKVNLRL